MIKWRCQSDYAKIENEAFRNTDFYRLVWLANAAKWVCVTSGEHVKPGGAQQHILAPDVFTMNYPSRKP